MATLLTPMRKHSERVLHVQLCFTDDHLKGMQSRQDGFTESIDDRLKGMHSWRDSFTESTDLCLK